MVWGGLGRFLRLGSSPDGWWLREVFEGFLTILVGFSWVSGNDLCLVCRGFSHGFRWFQVGFWVGFRWFFFFK